MDWRKKVMVTGGDGFLGRHLVPQLRALGADVFVPLYPEYDLTKEADVIRAFSQAPQIVIHLAADVGGIAYVSANAGQVYYNNTMMNTLLLEHARRNKVERFVAISTVNAYPADAPVPFAEEVLWNGNPDRAMIGYGMPKRTMILQSLLYAQQYGFFTVNLVLDSLYGPGDVFEKGKARVIPSNIQRCIEAKESNAPSITVWGTGASKRDYVYVEDAVRAILYFLEHATTSDPINIGTGEPVSVKELVETISSLCGYEGEILWDATKPDGQLLRYLDTAKAESLGFKTQTPLRDGLQKTIEWYKEQNKQL
jgi:GDP-L-fucose synthase